MGKKHTGTAGPLGLIATGMGGAMVCLAMMYPRAGGYMTPMIYVFSGIFQIIAAIIELYRQDVFHGTVFGSVGCFWLGVALGCMSGIYFIGWGILVSGFLFLSLRRNIGSILLFASAALALFLTGAGVGLNRPNYDLAYAGLWTFVISGALAVYAAFATLIHEAYGILLPFVAPMPMWFPLCCIVPRQHKKGKVTSILGLQFTPSERAYYQGSPTSSLASADALPAMQHL